MTDESQILAVLDELLKEVDNLQKKQPKDGGDKLDLVHAKLTSLEAQISTIGQQIVKSTANSKTGEIIARLEEIKTARTEAGKVNDIQKKDSTIERYFWPIVVFFFICLITLIVVDMRNENITKQRDQYRLEAKAEHDNFMKYRYLLLLGNSS